MAIVCSAVETMDITLAALDVDIVPAELDGDPLAADYLSKLNYGNCFAFENFELSTNAYEYRHSDIDTYPGRQAYMPSADFDYFSLFEFAAKLDPVPTMLTQCHVGTVRGFMGQTTAFRKSLLKKFVTVMGEVEGQDEARYIHGNYGKPLSPQYGNRIFPTYDGSRWRHYSLNYRGISGKSWEEAGNGSPA